MQVGRVLTTIETHTAGGPTRILTSGLPPLPGGSVREKMESFRSHIVSLRMEVLVGVVSQLPKMEEGRVLSTALCTPPAFVQSPAWT